MARTDQAELSLPFMSVIVCTYNGERVIARALDSLLAQDYPEDLFEVIVVDDGSADHVAEVAARYPVRTIRHEYNRGLAAARNTGLIHMKGDVYVSFDDDCIVDPGWLRQLATGYQQENVAGVGSLIEEPGQLSGIANRFMAAAGSANPPSLRLGASRNPFRRFLAYAADQARTGSQPANIYEVRQLYGATATFPAATLRAVGGWNESLRAAEDSDLCTRIAAEYPHLRFLTVATARVVHDPGMTLKRFLQRPYLRGADTLHYYRACRLTPPIFPLPIAWLAATAAAVAVSPLPGLLTAIALPQILYFWWPLRAVRERSILHLLYAYLQLSEESATIAGLARGYALSRKGSHQVPAKSQP